MYAHVSWHTWERIGCIDAKTADDVRRAAAIAAQREGMRVLKLAILADHVHIALSFRPDARVSDFVRVAKCGSAVMANRRVFGQLKWARGYYVATFHRLGLSALIGYVATQHQRHPERIPRGGVH